MSLGAAATEGPLLTFGARSHPLIGRKVGRYRIVDLLGIGGMAKVWRARDELLGHAVALKTLGEDLADSPDARRRFAHEAIVATGLDHPSVAAVYEAGESEGIAYIAMALIDGETLSDRVQRSLLPIGEALHIVRVAASALGYAHTRGVVHRDVTSRNIMIARDGRVLVLDFGLALAAGISRVSSSNTTVGTAAYMAPEVMRGQTADPRSDLYGLGIVLYEALTGALPFRGERAEVIQWGALTQEVRAPSAIRREIPPELDHIVLKALARDPKERHQNADELLADLSSVMETVASRPAARAEGRTRSHVADLLVAGEGPIYLGILGFQDRGPAADTDGARARLAAELTEALAAALPSTSLIHVVLPPEGAWPEPGWDPQRIAQQLGANLLLQGTIRSSAASIRVTFTLVDPESGQHIGGGAVGGALVDTFSLEDQLVAQVRGVLGLDAAPEPRRATSRDPAAREHYDQAMRYLQRTDNEASLDGAITLLIQLLRTEGEDAAVHAALARAYLLKHRRTGQHVWEGRAAAAVERAMALDPEAPDTLIALADLYAETGRYDEAVAEYQRGLDVRPDLFEGHLGLARALDALQRSTEAEEACRRAIETRPEDWRGHHLLGEFFFKKGQYARAIEPWRKSVQLTPDNALGVSDLGSAYFHLDRCEDAIAAYRRSIEIQPNARAFTNLGTVLFYLGRYDEAAEVFEKAVRLTPSDPVFWGNLGNACWFTAGRKPRANEALRRAIDLMRERLSRRPDDAEALSRMAGWLANLDAREEAREVIEKALAIAPDNMRCIVDAAVVYEQIGLRERALHWAGEAVRGGYSPATLMRSPVLGSLKGDPEFERILQLGAAGVDPGRKLSPKEEAADG